MDEAGSFKRIALAAAPIFLADGYMGVSLRSLADKMNMKAASLYYHCPGGKAELYARSLGVFLSEYRLGLEASRGRASFPRAVLRMAGWMVERPPVDISRVARVDLPHLEQESANQLMHELHDAVLVPIASALERGQQRGKVKPTVNTGVAAASVLAMVNGLGFSHLPSGRPPTAQELAAANEVLADGLKLLFDGLAT